MIDKKYKFVSQISNSHPSDLVNIDSAYTLLHTIKDLNLEPWSIIQIFEENNCDFYVEEDLWNNAGRLIIESILKNPAELKFWQEVIIKKISKIKKNTKRLTKINFAKLSNMELFKELTELHSLQKEYFLDTIIFNTPNYVPDGTQKYLGKVLEELGYAQDKILPILFRSEIDSPIYEYETAIKELALKAVKDKAPLSSNKLFINEKYKEDINKIISEFSWITASFNGIGKSFSEIVSDTQEIIKNKNNMENFIINRISEREKELKQRKELIEELINKSNNKQKIIIELAIKSAEYMPRLIDEIMKEAFVTNSLYEEIGKRIGLERSNIKHLNLEEIKSYLIEKKEIDFGNIEKRQMLSVYLINKGEIIIKTEEEAQQLRDFLKVMKNDSKLKELKGQVACKGQGKIITGIARLVKSIDDMNKVKQGDILISSRTYPDLLPAMKRSAAIIAEFNGLLTHAAIVSRELNIPCIVGVNNAMETIKEGDILEIDTENNLIKIK